MLSTVVKLRPHWYKNAREAGRGEACVAMWTPNRGEENCLCSVWGQTNAIHLESVLQREFHSPTYWYGRLFFASRLFFFASHKFAAQISTIFGDYHNSRVFARLLGAMSWDKEKCLKLIKQFEINEILWKKNDKDYHNIIKKEDAWRKIGEVMGEDSGTCKKKWRVFAAPGDERNKEWMSR